MCQINIYKYQYVYIFVSLFIFLLVFCEHKVIFEVRDLSRFN